jgi:predicted nucleotidyltransferase
MRQALKERVHQEYGVTFISAVRFGFRRDTDVAILLSSAKPVSVNLIADLKQRVNDEMGQNVKVAVHALQETGVAKTKY